MAVRCMDPVYRLRRVDCGARDGGGAALDFYAVATKNNEALFPGEYKRQGIRRREVF